MVPPPRHPLVPRTEVLSKAEKLMRLMMSEKEVTVEESWRVLLVVLVINAEFIILGHAAERTLALGGRKQKAAFSKM
jgi:hypothetical protein